MSIRTTVVSLAAVFVVVVASGCEIHDCQEGAFCGDDDDFDRVRPDDARESCIGYCVRLSVCGAPQANDFDECVEACEERFERAPMPTRELCECAEWSSCSDVVDGHCSPHPPNAGGAGGRDGGSQAGRSSGGAPNYAGAPSGTGASPSTGGMLGAAGSPSPVGGSPASGGTSGGSAGTGGCTAGAGTGGASTAGSAGAAVGGESSEGGEGGESSCSCS